MDEGTLYAAQHGSVQAFERLITPYEQQIWRICWHLLHHTEDARDCAQEVMLKAWRALPSFRQESSLESWLYRIAVNTCNDFLRKKRRYPTESTEELQVKGFDPPDPTPGTEEQALRHTETLRLQEALNRLPDKLRLPLTLYALEEKSYEEIAVILRLPVGTVKSRIARAREALKKSLEITEQTDASTVQQRERRTPS